MSRREMCGGWRPGLAGRLVDASPLSQQLGHTRDQFDRFGSDGRE